MRKMKKLLAFLLASAMVLAMGAPALADETPTPMPTPAPSQYKITIDNTANQTVSISGKTYTASKLFDVTYTGANQSDPHAYRIDSDGDGAWAWDTIKGSLKEDSTTVYENDTYGLTFTPTAADGTVYVVTSTMDDAKARALADALQSAATNAKVKASVTATAETAEISLTQAGYYLVYGTVKANDPSDGSKELTAAVALTTADPTEKVEPKVSAPTLDKKINAGVGTDSQVHLLDTDGKAATAAVGATVTFELDSVVPDLTGYSNYTFIITDTMTEGLTFTDPDGEGEKTNDVAVKVNNVDKTSEVTSSVSGQTLTVTIPKTTLEAAQKGQSIVVIYTAKVNSSALTGSYEKNTAYLTYSNNPYSTTNSTNQTPNKEVYVIDADINVDKVATNASGNKLEHAKFKVFKGATQPEATALSWYKYDGSTNTVTWVAQADADEFETNDQGKFASAIRGLEAESSGTAYGLLETAAPDGYNLLDAPVSVTLTSAYNAMAKTVTVTATGATASNGTINLSSTRDNNQPLATAQVINLTGTQLPSTGGMGTTIFYILGSVLVVGAGAVLIVKRRLAR